MTESTPSTPLARRRQRPSPLASPAFPVFPIDIDTRENLLLTFPTYLIVGPTTWLIATRRVKLDWADYAPRGRANIIAVERKYSFNELVDNLHGRGEKRARRAFRRFAANCRNPYLLLDMSLADFMPADQTVGFLLDEVFQMLNGYNFRLIGPVRARSVATRCRLGELIARLFIAAICPSGKWDAETLGINEWDNADGMTRPPAKVVRSRIAKSNNQKVLTAVPKSGSIDRGDLEVQPIRTRRKRPAKAKKTTRQENRGKGPERPNRYLKGE